MVKQESHIIATVQLLPPPEGRSSICLEKAGYYGCPIFWPNNEQLNGQMNDVRMYATSPDTCIDDEHKTTVIIRFLYPEVIQLLHVGMKFRMWEGKDIGNGTIVELVV